MSVEEVGSPVRLWPSMHPYHILSTDVWLQFPPTVLTVIHGVLEINPPIAYIYGSVLTWIKLQRINRELNVTKSFEFPQNIPNLCAVQFFFWCLHITAIQTLVIFRRKETGVMFLLRSVERRHDRAVCVTNRGTVMRRPAASICLHPSSHVRDSSACLLSFTAVVFTLWMEKLRLDDSIIIACKTPTNSLHFFMWTKTVQVAVKKTCKKFREVGKPNIHVKL